MYTIKPLGGQAYTKSTLLYTFVFPLHKNSENEEVILFTIKIEPRHDKNLFMPYANNKGADQPAHPRSLISAFVFASEIVEYL